MRYLAILLFLSYSSLFAQDITLGGILPLAREGKLALWGLQAAINRYNNDPKSVHNVKLMVKDDDGDLARSERALIDLMSQTKIFFNVLTHGLSSQTKQIRKENDLLFWGPMENGADTQDPLDTTMVHVRPSLRRELEVLIHHAVEVKKKRSFAIFYESSEWGEQGKNVATQLFEQYKQKYPSLTISATKRYQSQTVEIDRAMNEIIEVSPEMILCISGRRATYHFIQKSLRKGLVHAQFMGPSRLLPLQSHVLKTRGLNLMVTAPVPHAKYSDLKIAKQYRDDIKKYYGKEHARAHVVSFTNYIHMRLFLTLLDTISEPYTHQKLWKIIKKLKQYNFGGLVCNFDAARNAIEWGFWLSSGDKKKWRRVS